MHKIYALTYIFSVICFAEAKETKLTVTSKGENLSNVLYDFFRKANKNFVLDREVIRKASEIKLYLNFNEVTFNAALEAICKNYGLNTDYKNNIYYFSLGTYNELNSVTEEKRPKVLTHLPDPNINVSLELKPTLKKDDFLGQKKQLPKIVLKRIITVRFKRVDLRHLLNVLGKQLNITIEVSEDVPRYRLDAFLVKTSLEYALREITRQTKLAYEFTDHETIRVFKK